jgi:cytosine/adenosine deaminase-related metal-dependent hydrolase
MLGWLAATTFINARVMTPLGEAQTIRTRRRILAIDEPPQPGDHVVDLEGRMVLPGLINAHDHLELNHYGRIKGRERYGNAGEWIDDLRPMIRQCPAILERSRVPLADRLFVGALKNLLSGVTLVAHHNPIYRAFGLQYPVRVLKECGWAHSIGLEHGPAGANGEPGGVVDERCDATRPDVPFIVHAAEGIDRAAESEIDALEARGCLRANTVLVHGVAVRAQRWGELFERGVSLTWCPSSNQFLFGRTLCAPCLLDVPGARGRVCLGTDSRLTGAGDLLDELRIARAEGVAADDLFAMVTSSAADILRRADAGRLTVGAPADLLVLSGPVGSAGEALLRSTRADVALVTIGGTPLIAEPALAAVFNRRCMHQRAIIVDGRERTAQAWLARRIERCALREPGVSPRT